mmetsp:Transcript_37726/g.119087  ORF Transcript_37726/g.119087 Transcript_37726/m.119087 type:complete len:217 (+) Transcript_37726:2-652(+)
MAKEVQAEGMVAELTGVVTAQKTKIASLAAEARVAAVERKKSRQLEDDLLRLKVFEDESASAKMEADAARQDAAAARHDAAVAQQEAARGVQRAAEAGAEAVAKARAMGEHVARLTQELETLTARLAAAEDAVKVKSKMLDSQNESLTQAKHALEAERGARKRAEQDQAAAEDRAEDARLEEADRVASLRWGEWPLEIANAPGLCGFEGGRAPGRG